MAVNQKTIFVYDDFSTEQPVLMGSLYVNVIKGGESYSFEYDKDWLRKTGLTLTLDPELMPYSGRQYPTGKNIFGLFADASPDRWGRVLMNKRERILAEKEGRKPSKLYDSDYLLGVYDETRMGGIRFKANQEGPFLSDDNETAAPPWATLRTLEEASRNFENDETGLTEKWLNQLIKPGSSLGGPDRRQPQWIQRISFGLQSSHQRTMKVIPELGKCIVFNMAVTNTDDHLRNHAFILTDKGWILSPLYDVNPVPYGDELSLNVDEEDNSISIDLAVQTAVRFGVSESDAEAQAEEILKIVRGNWEKTAAGYVLTRRQIEEMRPAFSACYE